MRILTPGVTVGVLFIAGVAHATSFSPYAEKCVADVNGQHYVVVKRKDKGDPYGAVTLTIAERRDGSPPVRSASAAHADGDTYRATVDARIRVRDGDIVHGRIELDQPPGVILVSLNGKWVVTLDVYGFNNTGPQPGDDDLVIYSIKGNVVHRKNRASLFDEEARNGFPRIDGCLSWLGGAWLDEQRGEVVVVGGSRRDQDKAPPILTVNLTSGDVRRGGPDLIDRAISERNLPALPKALDLARSLRLAGSKASLPAIVADEKVPLGVRLQAAVLLGSLGDRTGADLLAKTATLAAEMEIDPLKFVRPAEVDYAIRNSGDLLGEDALPILKKTLLKNGRTFDLSLSDAFRSLGQKGVPTLIEVLEDDRNFEAQLAACTCLGFVGPAAEGAVPALRRALQKKGSTKWGVLTLRLDSHAAWALGHLGEKAKVAIPDLEKLAQDGDEHARDSARRALGELRPQPARP